jgi:hypothetical protein
VRAGRRQAAARGVRRECRHRHPGLLRRADPGATARAAACLGNTRTRLTAGEKPNRKRMATLVAVYDVEPAKRRPHDVIAPPGGRHGARKLRPGPRARGKWLAGSVRHDPAEMIAAAFGEAEARDPQHLRTWVVPVDGAEHQLDLIRAGPDAAPSRSTSSSASSTCSTSGKPPGACTRPATRRRGLGRGQGTRDTGDSGRASEEITGQAGSVGLSGRRRTGADACVRYLNARHEYLRCDQALAEGWPIATGVIEGACRHLRPPRHRRGQMGPGRRRSRPHPARGHQQNDLAVFEPFGSPWQRAG